MTKAATLAQMGNTNQTFRNRIINGAMVIDQRNAGASQSLSNGSGTYTLDRYRIFYDATSAVLTSQQVAPPSTAPAGFTYSQKITVSTAGSISSGTNCTYMQFIEGYNIADLGWGTTSPKSVTLSFWVYSSITGTFSVSFGDNSSVSYVTTYSISSANTWTQITLTVSGPTTGSWNTTNGTGLNLRWDLGCGSTVTTSTTNAWGSGTYYKATGSTSLITNSGATFYITGVQLEAGTTATPFEYRQYGTELALCQRYALKYNTDAILYAYIGMAYAFNSTTIASVSDRKSTRLNSSHTDISRMPSSA